MYKDTRATCITLGFIWPGESVAYVYIWAACL